MKPLKEKISITLDREVLLALREEAEQCDRSLSQFINVILKEYLHGEKNEELRRLLQGV